MWLKAHLEGTSSLKLSWGNALGPWRSYTVDINSLRLTKKDVHKALDKLTIWSRSKNAEDLPRLLKDLAIAGERLHFTLFNAEHPSTKNEITELREMLRDEYQRGDTQLTISMDPRFHVPWSLVFEGDPKSLAVNASKVSDFNGFWYLRHKLASVFTSYYPREGSLTRKRSNLRVLSLVNRSVVSQEFLDSQQVSAITEVFPHPVGAAYNLETFDKLIDEAAGSDTIFHFFGHQSNGNLVVSETEQVDAIDLSRKLNRLLEGVPSSEKQACTLLFLNACDSMHGDNDYSLRSTAARSGMCGAIATEAQVPINFAFDFGWALIKKLRTESRSLGEVMDLLHRDPSFWPLSMLYSSYAYRNLRFNGGENDDKS